MAAPSSQKLLGVRDAFRSFLENRFPTATVLVVPQQEAIEETSLPLSDEDSIALVEGRASGLFRRLGENYLFYVAAEGGLDLIEGEGGSRTFVRYWSAVYSDLGNAVGSSSAVEVPRNLITGLGREEVRYAFPGTRRSGGMLSALTGGTQTPRDAVTTATLNALTTLFYGILEGSMTAPQSPVPSPRKQR